METVVWEWGPFSVAVFSLAFIVAVVVGLVMVFAEGRRKFLSELRVVDLIILSLAGGISGSRLTYTLLFNQDYYLKNPVHLFRLQDGGMCFWGGLLIALLVVSIWAARKNLIVERYLDAATPALITALALGNIGFALRGAAMPYALPWSVEVGGVYYHPDGAYAIVLLMFLLFIVWKRRLINVYEGELFIWFLLGYSLINLVLDFSRAERPLLWIFTPGQLISLAAASFALYFILAGPKIIATSSPYLRRKSLNQGSRYQTLFQVLWFAALSGGMLALYYLSRRPLTL